MSTETEVAREPDALPHFWSPALAAAVDERLHGDSACVVHFEELSFSVPGTTVELGGITFMIEDATARRITRVGIPARDREEDGHA